MQRNDILTLTIDKISNLGTGIAKFDGEVIFVSGSCPDDVVKAKINKVSKNYAEAETVEVLSPSGHRIQPFCPMQKVCGSCQMQFIDYEYQLELKRQIVQDTMKKIGGLDIEIPKPVPSPKIRNYRYKVQYPVVQKPSGRIIAGYYKPQSHECVNIKYCPIQPQICDEIIEFIREKAPEYDITGYDEKTYGGMLRHVVIRCSEYSEENLVTLVLNSENVSKNIKDFAKAIKNGFDKVSGVCVNFNPKKTNVIFGEKTQCLLGKDYIEEKIIDKIFKIGADTFFQVNPSSAENIFKAVKDEVSRFENPKVLDAYAGIATFGIVVSDYAKEVVSVEENEASISMAKDVLIQNNIKNVKLYAQDTLKYLKSCGRKFDITILDPPRKGCTREVLDETLTHTKTEIIYVSCNPSTLARDLKYLCEKGCKVKNIQPYDMFCHTYHIENVSIISV